MSFCDSTLQQRLFSQSRQIVVTLAAMNEVGRAESFDIPTRSFMVTVIILKFVFLRYCHNKIPMQRKGCVIALGMGPSAFVTAAEFS